MKYSVAPTEERQRDFGGGFQDSAGENLFEGNGEKAGFDVRLAGKAGTCYVRFNRWPKGKPRTTVSPGQGLNGPLPAPILDYLSVQVTTPEPSVSLSPEPVPCWK